MTRSSPSASGYTGSTECPSDSSSVAVASTAATHSGSTTAMPFGTVVTTPDAQRAGIGADLVEERARPAARRVRVAGHRAGDHVEDRRAVAHRAGEHVAHHETRPRLAFVGTERRPGHAWA